MLSDSSLDTVLVPLDQNNEILDLRIQVNESWIRFSIKAVNLRLRLYKLCSSCVSIKSHK